MRNGITVAKYFCLINVIATLFVFCMWTVNGYKPVLALSLTWGLYFGFSMYSKFKLLNILSKMTNEQIIQFSEQKPANEENNDV